MFFTEKHLGFTFLTRIHNNKNMGYDIWAKIVQDDSQKKYFSPLNNTKFSDSI